MAANRVVPQAITRTVEKPTLLAKGRFRSNTRVWHAVGSGRDKATRGGHLQELKDSWPNLNYQALDECCIIENGVKCTEASEVGAHVYCINDMGSTSRVCQIVPTCSCHNNYYVCRSEGWNFGGEGVQVAEGTPFTVRRMTDRGWAGKGGYWPEQNLVAENLETDSILEFVTEFLFLI